MNNIMTRITNSIANKATNKATNNTMNNTASITNTLEQEIEDARNCISKLREELEHAVFNTSGAGVSAIHRKLSVVHAGLDILIASQSVVSPTQ